MSLIRQATRFMTTMRELQKAMHHSRDDIPMCKIAFESNKKDLETLMKHVQLEIENSKMDVLRKGESFGAINPGLSPESKTMKNVDTLKNILSMQSKELNRSQKLPSSNFSMPVSKSCQTCQTDTWFPTQSPNIQHYKPIELIRVEEENLQMKSELITMQTFVDEYKNKNEHLTKCVQEGNTNKFLQEQEIHRLKGRYQQIHEKYIELKGEDESIDELQESKKQVQFQDHEFETNLIDVRQTIKETNELIEYSKLNRFDQEKLDTPKSIKKGQNPFKKNEGL